LNLPNSLAIADLSVVILTYNEEVNLPQALDSVCGWARRIFVVDSFSTDRTVEIARSHGCEVYEFEFENYSKQRNRALTELPIDTAWTLFLDADEWIPDGLKSEIGAVIESNPSQNGFFLRRRFLWMNQWIRRGYYPTWILRLFRTGSARCEERAVNEHILVDGQTGYLSHDFMHQDHKSISDWIQKHNRYAIKEAEELVAQANTDKKASPSLFGPQAQRVRWLRERVYNQLPPLLRPFLFFTYRVLIRGGILDGGWALVYHFLQAFWYPLLIDVLFLEKRARATGKSGELGTAFQLAD
jgi:glycosyltransferase involved in cell wall biosynthesis